MCLILMGNALIFVDRQVDEANEVCVEACVIEDLEDVEDCCLHHILSKCGEEVIEQHRQKYQRVQADPVN